MMRRIRRGAMWSAALAAGRSPGADGSPSPPNKHVAEAVNMPRKR